MFLQHKAAALRDNATERRPSVERCAQAHENGGLNVE